MFSRDQTIRDQAILTEKKMTKMVKSASSSKSPIVTFIVRLRPLLAVVVMMGTMAEVRLCSLNRVKVCIRWAGVVVGGPNKHRTFTKETGVGVPCWVNFWQFTVTVPKSLWIQAQTMIFFLNLTKDFCCLNLTKNIRNHNRSCFTTLTTCSNINHMFKTLHCVTVIYV